jgi:hypothetical protein
LLRAELQTAHELDKQLLSLAQGTQDPGLLAMAHCALGTTLLYLGELTSAQAHLEQSIALYDPQQHHSLAFVQDPGVISMSYAAWAL